MNKLNSYDIANFLRDNGHNVHSVDLSDMIRAFDNDNDGYLDLQEF
jgi:Ca2+-binding EF-hand superfamily protein